jgi:hypothetical protein
MYYSVRCFLHNRIVEYCPSLLWRSLTFNERGQYPLESDIFVPFRSNESPSNERLLVQCRASEG